MLSWAALLAGLAVLGGCDRGEGFAPPGDSRSLRPLGYFTGRAAHGGDTAAASRLINLDHPRVAILWRSVGMRDKVASDGQVSISANAPFAFSLNLLQPPPKEVLEAPDLMFGFVTLFCDANENHAFDRGMHPDYYADYDHIDSMVAQLGRARQELMIHAVVLPPRLVEERFFLNADGSIWKESGSGLDSVMNVKLLPSAKPDSILKGWVGNDSRILGRQNRYERFFALRKKDNEFFYDEFAAPGHYKGLRGRFERSLFPKPGHESEFEAALKRTSIASMILSIEADQVFIKAAYAGRLDYPFNGYGQAGTDWMAGRSVTDLLLYVASEASRDSLLDAVPQSAFRVSHLERFRIGYNLFHCDDQYVCDVRATGDSILVYLGTTELFFNKPSAPSKAPFPSPSPSYEGSAARPHAAPPVENLAYLQGAYALNGSDTVRLVLRHGELWCQSSEAGLIRVAPADSFGFASPDLDFQGLFTPGFTGRPDRLILYRPGRQSVYGRVAGGASGVPASLLERIDRAAGFTHADLPDSVLERCAGVYDFGGDTLRIVRAGGDSLKVDLPKFRNLVFHAAGDFLFRCPWGEWTLEFQGFRDGSPSRAAFGNGAVKLVVPRFGITPSKALKSDKTDAAGITWMAEHSGTGRDAYTGLNGRKRYACSRDGAFLRPGDGFLEGYSRGYVSDSISLRGGGDEATFRITGMRGKLALFQLRSCAERGVKSGRIRVSIWSGSEPGALRPSYGDHQWMDADTSGVYWSLDSLSIDADPFYLVLKQENTQDAKFHNAFDGYRMGVRQ
ncbi:MAG: hypothetical protein ABIW76_12325 [Fibrobacteria bacterium]